MNRQDTTPLADLLAPLSFARPSDAAQVTLVGRTGEPPLVTRTDATTVGPAFGRVGASLTAVAFALAVPPPDPPLPPPLVGSATTMVIADALLERSLSMSDSAASSARGVYVPFCGATT